MLAVGYSVVATLTMIGAGRSVCYCVTVFYLDVYLAPINRRLFWSRCRRFASTNCLKCARLGKMPCGLVIAQCPGGVSCAGHSKVLR